ncbi:MAG: hypothetical protein Q8Q31_02190 [Nanoarchaeota archaeon]|nr:hypothetical protein [Nanoarchaeota archaeon]
MEKRGKQVAHIFSFLTILILLASFSSAIDITDQEAQGLGYMDAADWKAGTGGMFSDFDAQSLGYKDVQDYMVKKGLVSPATSSAGSASGGNSQVSSNVVGAMNTFAATVSPIFSQLLGDTSSGEYLFARVLILILVFVVIFGAMKAASFFSGQTWISVVIGVIGALLATRWLASADLIETVILPYTVLGVAISCGIPFLIYFWVVEKGLPHSATLRRFAWILFGVVFIGIWLSRLDKLSQSGEFAVVYIYPVTALLCLLMAVLDGTIRKFMAKVEYEKYGADTNERAMIELRRRMAESKNDLANGIISQSEYDKLHKNLSKKYATLAKT